MSTSPDQLAQKAAQGTAARPRRRYRTIEKSTGWPKIDLVELWHFRHLLAMFFARDFTARYKQTTLGVFWIIIQPLSTMIIYSIFFGYVARIQTGNLPYAVFIMGGIVIWQYFSRAVNEGSTSLTAFQSLISKIYFPRLLAPIASMFGALLDFAVMLVILLGVMVYFKVFPNWHIVLTPLFLAMAAFWALAISLCLTGLDARFRDVRHALNFGMQVWYFASPIVYPYTLIPEQWRDLYLCNPMTPVVLGFRWAFLGDGVAPPLWSIGLSLLLGSIVMIVGLFMFQRIERNVVDHL